MLYGNNQNPLFSTGGGIGRPLGQTLPPLQQQQQQPQQIPAPGWALQPQNQSAPAPKPAQQPHTAFIQYSNSHRQLPIPCTRQDNQLPQGFVQTIPITSSHQQHPQHSQQASLHHGWMDAPGTSTAYSITTIPTTSNGLTTHNANGTLPSGFSQFSSSGFNGQIVTALTTANGIMPSTSIPSSNSTGVTAPTPQSIQPAVVGAVKQTKELEDYYIAERARQNVQSIAAAASQIYGQASGGQKLPKLEGLPAGVIPAGGIRKPKQGRPRADVAQPGGGASTSAASAAAGGATVKSELSPTPTTSNGTGRSRPESGATGGEIVNYLMGFNIQVAEADFSSKALESLHKKIKDRPHDLETFMRAVETKGEVIGNCITVTRTLDGRLQVAGRKGFPHVIYAKIFRFQELHKNELKSIPQCIYGFDNKAENEEHKPDAQVCVNPYHYERVTAPSGGGNLIDPLTGLLRANALQSMDEMMDFASSSMKMTTPETTPSGGGQSSSKCAWPVVTVDDDSDAKKEEHIVVDSSDNDDAAPAPPQLQPHFQGDYLEQMRRLYAEQQQQQPRSISSTSAAAATITSAYKGMQLTQQPRPTPGSSLEQETLRIQAALQQLTSPTLKMDSTSTSAIAGQQQLLFPSDPARVADPFQAAGLLPFSQQLSVDTVLPSPTAVAAPPATPSDLSALCGFPSYSALHAAAAAAAAPLPAPQEPNEEKMEEDPTEFADAEEEELRRHLAMVEKLRQKKAAAEAHKLQQLQQLPLRMHQQPGTPTSTTTTDAILTQMARMLSSKNDGISTDERLVGEEQKRAFADSILAEFDANQPGTSSSSDPAKREEREKAVLKMLGMLDGEAEARASREVPPTTENAKPNFLQSRPSMLSNPPAQGGFGFTSFDAKAVTDKAGSSQEKPSSALSDEFLKMAAGLSKGDAEQLNELIEHIKRYSVAEKLAMAPDTSDEAHESESDQTNDEAIEVHPSLSLVARKNFAFDKLLLENSKEKARLDEMKKEKEEEDAERIPTDDPDWPEEMMERQKKAQELAEHERRFKKGEERLANMMMARDQDFANIEDATIWNSQYNDDSGRPCFFRKNHIVGLPPNNKVVVGETGSGTFGSKGPHRKPQQLFSKELEWSLQQVVKMLATCALDGNISTTQYMLCCQHYAGMMKKTAGAQSLDPEQVKLCKAALESVKEAAGGVVTTQQLHSWDLSRLFANHLKTRPQRGEEQLARRNAACALNREWTFEINQEMDKFVAETKGTDAEGIFSKKQIERALAARQRLVRGEKLVPDELMAVEELRREKDSRKRGRAEAGLDHEMEAIDLNSMGMSVEEQGQEEDFDPILPVLENAFTSDDLNALFETPNEYLRTFRDHVFGDATVNTYQEEMDISLRGTVPPPEGDERFQPFDGRERENDEPDENGEERPPLKRNCLCPEAEKKDHCFWGKHHHYMHGVSREIVDAAFLLYRYRIQRKKSSGPRGELYNFATQFDCPKVCLKRAMEIEPHSAKLKPPNYHWCAVNYCERDNHVGSMRQVEAVNFFIDGGFESVHEQRYCISSVSHPLTRFDKQVNDVRSRIGCGVRISVKEDGSMWVRVLSRYPVFISSTFLDREAGLVNGDAIHKIYPGSSIKAFDLVRARRAILQMYEYQKEAYKLHNGEKKLESMPYPLNTFNRRELRSISRIGGDDLHKHAVVKIGFIKGWGPEFEYKKICETPCWVEIINNRACEFIDHIMNLREVCYAFSEHDSSDYE